MPSVATVADLMTELSVLNGFLGVQRETRPVIDTGFQPPFLFQQIIPKFPIGFN